MKFLRAVALVSVLFAAPHHTAVATATGEATATATSLTVQGLALGESRKSEKVFAYHHTQADASKRNARGLQQGRNHNNEKNERSSHAPHSSSDIALPQMMRFAGLHAFAHAAEASEVGKGEQHSQAKSTKSKSSAKTKSKSKSKSKSTSKAVPGGGASEPTSKTEYDSHYPGDASVLTMKLSSPIYGSYSRNYGSVSQPLSEGSGYGGFTANVDPTGFNFRHDEDTPDGGQRGWGASSLGGAPFASLFPARLKVRQATSVNGLSPLGITAGLHDATYTIMGPKSLGPYGVDGMGTLSPGPGANLVGAGVALPPPTAGPSAMVLSPSASFSGNNLVTVGTPSTGGNVVHMISRRMRLPSHRHGRKSKVFVINPGSSTGTIALAGIGAGLAGNAGPGLTTGRLGSIGMQTDNTAISPTVAQLSGRPIVAGAPINGLRLTYDPMMVTQRALYMQGGINKYNTPGVVKQLGVSYPSPAFDRYATVIPGSQLSMPVHTSPISNLLLGANINADQTRNMLMSREARMMHMMGMGGMMGGMGGAMGGMGGAMGGMGGAMGGMGMGGMGGAMGGMGGV